MITTWRTLARNWPLVAALAAAAMLAIAHAFETFGHLQPCELCLKQRDVYWLALGLGVAGYVLARLLRRPMVAPMESGILALVFLLSAGVAGYHAGVEWKWWPGPQTCSGSTGVGAQALASLLSGARITAPRCDQPQWIWLGLSMAGWNTLVSVGLTAASLCAAWTGFDQARRRPLS
jgi:disulfide bond formation protein DsbB